MKFLKLMLFEIPLFFLADSVTLEKLRKTFVSGRYLVWPLDDVKCALREDRLDKQQQVLCSLICLIS